MTEASCGTVNAMRDALHQGLARHQAGDLSQAVDCYNRVLAMQPNQADALHYKGVALFEGGQEEAAVNYLSRAVIGKPDSAEAFNHFGCALLSLTRTSEAETAFRRARSLNGEHAEAHFNHATVLSTLSRPDEALEALERAVKLAPDQTAWLIKLAEACKDIGDIERAGLLLENALLREGGSLDAFFQRSKVRGLVGQGSGAMRDLVRCAILAPGNFVILNNLANLHLSALDANTSARIMARATTLAPQDPTIRYNNANSLLANGLLEQGWVEYRWRHRKEEVFVERHGLPPEWGGGEINNGGLLIYQEQGIGDELRFASCLTAAATAANTSCLVECDNRLIPLYNRSFPTLEFMGKLPRDTGPPTSVDFTNIVRKKNIAVHSALGDLPRHVRPTLSSFTDAGPYLVPATQARIAWQKKLKKLGPGQKVGFLWRTGLPNKIYAHYFFDILDLRTLFLLPHAQFVNLQYDECEADLQRAEQELGIDIYRPDGINLRNDLDGLSALIRELDVVIGPMTSVLAMAGAVGTRCIGMPIGLDWTSLGTDGQPWTPNMTVVYKGPDRNWKSAIEDVAAIVAALPNSSV